LREHFSHYKDHLVDNSLRKGENYGIFWNILSLTLKMKISLIFPNQGCHQQAAPKGQKSQLKHCKGRDSTTGVYVRVCIFNIMYIMYVC
jgi:hypothetical protein